MFGLRSHGLQELLSWTRAVADTYRGYYHHKYHLLPLRPQPSNTAGGSRRRAIPQPQFCCWLGRHFRVPCRMSGSIADSYPPDAVAAAAPRPRTTVTTKITSRCCQMSLGRQDGLRTTDVEMLSEMPSWPARGHHECLSSQALSCKRVVLVTSQRWDLATCQTWQPMGCWVLTARDIWQLWVCLTSVKWEIYQLLPQQITVGVFVMLLTSGELTWFWVLIAPTCGRWKVAT